MQVVYQIELSGAPDQVRKLNMLQQTFAEVCNALSPIVVENRCWNRVALHHLAYKQMRERFPEVGAQMVCNAIYAVSKVARQVYQHPGSPFYLKKLGQAQLPTLRFAVNCPVYFDSHTLTINAHDVSLFTMDGRVKFMVAGQVSQLETLKNQKIQEIALQEVSGGQFVLLFKLSPGQAVAEPEKEGLAMVSEEMQLNSYIKVGVGS